MEKLTLLKEGKKTKYPQCPDDVELETFENKFPEINHQVTLDIEDPVTSLCPVTSQPDFCQIQIEYVPDKSLIESKSLKLYCFSFRNFGTFHETLINTFLKDLVSACQPKEMVVTGKSRPRGGISIINKASYSRKQGFDLVKE